MEHIFVEFMHELFGIDRATSTAIFSILQWMIPTAAGALIVLWLYTTRNFNDQITYSANLLTPHEDGFQLQLRTLEVLPKEDLLPSNLWFRIRLFWAIRRCTVDDPFIKMSKADMDVLQPAIINGLSRLFADGIFARMHNQPTEEQDMLIGITYEKYGAAKTRKIRVIVARFDVLGIAMRKDEKFYFERDHEADRLKTLRRMAAHFRAHMDPNALKLVRPVHGYVRA